MDFLQAAIQQKQQSLQKKRTWSSQQRVASNSGADHTPTAATAVAPAEEEGAPARKYVRRGEIRQLEEQERDRQRQLEKEQRQAKARAAEDEGLASSTSASSPRGQAEASSHSPEAQAGDSSGAAGQQSRISSTEIRRRLRMIGQPITLFGETDADRLRRLKQTELDHLERLTGSSAGKRNVLQDILLQDAERDIQQDLLRAYGDAAAAVEAAAAENPLVAGEDVPETGDDGGKAEEKERQERNEARYAQDRNLESFCDPQALAATEPRAGLDGAELKARAKARQAVLRKGVSGYLLFWLKRMLWLWELDLLARPEDEKRTPQGRLASAQQKQTRQYLKPLIRKLRTGTLAPDVISGVRKIVDFCREGEYVQAGREFMVLSIGHAAWPMGQTMVGIHERSGREKISEHNVAHILDDVESQRWIHALKRLMTFSQNKFPSTPSKMVRL